MKKLILLGFLLMVFHRADADVSFRFGSGINNSALKTDMEKNISTLLTEINSAAQSGRTLNLSNVYMESAAKERLIKWWEDLPFECEDNDNVSRCLNELNGYQVRGIMIKMNPKDATYHQSIHRELTISLDKNGIITGVRQALEKHEDVSKIMGEGQDVADLAMRREILKWVEDFRNYYNERNLNSLKQIYSDDALIITGSVTLSRPSKSEYDRSNLESNVKYTKQSKAEYIKNLERTFYVNKYINVKFSDISVVKHGAKENIYGVTLKQKWSSSNYSDEGWLFLLWDFNDPEAPQIHVRTWQPEQIVVEHGVFTLDDFFIP